MAKKRYYSRVEGHLIDTIRDKERVIIRFRGKVYETDDKVEQAILDDNYLVSTKPPVVFGGKITQEAAETAVKELAETKKELEQARAKIAKLQATGEKE